MMISSLHRRRMRYNQELQDLLRQLECLPNGELYFVRDGSYWKWKCRWQSADGSRKSESLRKTDLRLAQELAYGRYLSQRVQGLRQVIRKLEDAIRAEEGLISYPDKLQETCNDYRELLRPFCGHNDDTVAAWKAARYQSGADRPAQRIHPTKSGVLVRSKSEAIIADLLHDTGIPFRYEPEVVVERDIIHPDFLILDPTTLKEILWEHCGLMDDPDYARRFFSRLHLLYMAGFSFEKKNLICTFESREHPLDIHYLQMLVEYYFTDL